MTIASATNKSGPYFYNGAATSFAYGFKISNEAHIRVVETVTATGVETDLVLTTDYTVTGVGADTGNVVISPARATGKSVTLVRNVPFTQDVVLENQGAYFAKVVEGALDDAAARDQQLAETISRAVVVPVSSSTDPAALIAELTAGSAAAVAAAASTAADVVLTHADVVLTHADAAATAAGRVQTGLDVAATAADRTAVATDRAAVAADKTTVANDKTTVAADKATVAANTTTTNTNAGLTAADRVQTGLDRVATAADRVQTGADRVQTGLDRVAAAASAASVDVNNLIRKEIDQNAQAETAPRKINILKNTLQAWELIETVDTTSIVSYIRTGLSAYLALHVEGFVLPVDNTTSLLVRLSEDNGATFVSSGIYGRQTHYGSGTSAVASYSNTDTNFTVTGSIVNSVTYGGVDFEFTLQKFNKARRTIFRALTGIDGIVMATAGMMGSNIANDAIRIAMNTGNIAQAQFRLWGIRG